MIAGPIWRHIFHVGFILEVGKRLAVGSFSRVAIKLAIQPSGPYQTLPDPHKPPYAPIYPTEPSDPTGLWASGSSRSPNCRNKLYGFMVQFCLLMRRIKALFQRLIHLRNTI